MFSQVHSTRTHIGFYISSSAATDLFCLDRLFACPTSADGVTSVAHSSGSVANLLPTDMAITPSSDAFLYACSASETLPVAKLSGSLAYTNFLTTR